MSKLKYELVNGNYVDVTFDQWDYEIDGSVCKSNILFVVYEPIQRLYNFDNMIITVKKNGSHSRVTITAKQLGPSESLCKVVSFYKTFKNCTIENAKDTTVKEIENDELYDVSWNDPR